MDEYGPEVLNTPPTEGLFLAAWVLPVVVLVAGALGLLSLVRRRGLTDSASAGAATRHGAANDVDADAEAVDRLERLAADDRR